MGHRSLRWERSLQRVRVVRRGVDVPLQAGSGRAVFLWVCPQTNSSHGLLGRLEQTPAQPDPTALLSWGSPPKPGGWGGGRSQGPSPSGRGAPPELAAPNPETAGLQRSRRCCWQCLPLSGSWRCSGAVGSVKFTGASTNGAFLSSPLNLPMPAAQGSDFCWLEGFPGCFVQPSGAEVSRSPDGCPEPVPERRFGSLEARTGWEQPLLRRARPTRCPLLLSGVSHPVQGPGAACRVSSRGGEESPPGPRPEDAPRGPPELGGSGRGLVWIKGRGGYWRAANWHMCSAAPNCRKLLPGDVWVICEPARAEQHQGCSVLPPMREGLQLNSAQPCCVFAAFVSVPFPSDHSLLPAPAPQHPAFEAPCPAAPATSLTGRREAGRRHVLAAPAPGSFSLGFTTDLSSPEPSRAAGERLELPEAQTESHEGLLLLPPARSRAPTQQQPGGSVTLS